MRFDGGDEVRAGDEPGFQRGTSEGARCLKVGRGDENNVERVRGFHVQVLDEKVDCDRVKTRVAGRARHVLATAIRDSYWHEVGVGCGRRVNEMTLFRIMIAVWLLTAGGVSAREGYVETRDGKVFEGHVRFESNAVVVVDVGRVLRVEVSLTNLAALTFLSQSEEPELFSFGTGALPESGELPSPWMSEDVGGVRVSGSAEFRRGAFRVRSSGTNAVGTADAGHFVFKPVADRSELVARVSKVQQIGRASCRERVWR